MEEKKDWILNNIHLKEGGIEDLLFEFSHAVIEDYQEKIEDDETLTRIPIAKKIDEEVYNLVQQELDKAREEVLLELLEKKTNYKIEEVGHGYKVTQEYVLVSDIEEKISKLTTK